MAAEQQHRQRSFRFTSLVLVLLAQLLFIPTSFSQAPDIDRENLPQKAQVFAGTLPTQDGKQVPVTGTVEVLPDNLTFEQIKGIRDSFENDGAIPVPTDGTNSRSKPLILVIDTPSKRTPVNPIYEQLFHIQRIVIDDSLIAKFQRQTNNFCSVLNMCFHEFHSSPVKFAKILAPLAGVTAAVSGLIHPTVAIGTMTVHPALFAVWQSFFMMSYTYWKTRFSPGIDALFSYHAEPAISRVRRGVNDISYFAKNYAFDISTALMINLAMGNPNSPESVILNSIALDLLANTYSTLRSRIIGSAINEYPEYAKMIQEGRRSIVLADKMLITPVTLILRSLFTVGIVGSKVPMIGGLIIYSSISIYRLIRGKNGVLADLQTQRAMRRLDRISTVTQNIWSGLMRVTFSACVTFFSPEHIDSIQPALNFLDRRFILPASAP